MYSRSVYENKRKSSNLLGAFTEFLLNLENIAGYKIKQTKKDHWPFLSLKKKLSRFKLCYNSFSLMSEMNYACNLHFSMCKITVIPISASALTLSHNSRGAPTEG